MADRAPKSDLPQIGEDEDRSWTTICLPHAFHYESSFLKTSCDFDRAKELFSNEERRIEAISNATKHVSFFGGQTLHHAHDGAIPSNRRRETAMKISTMLPVLLTFVCGFLIECACVFWVHYAERGAPGKTAFFSMIVGAAQVLGIGESIRGAAPMIAFVAGYTSGTYITVRFLKGRIERASERAREN